MTDATLVCIKDYKENRKENAVDHRLIFIGGEYNVLINQDAVNSNQCSDLAPLRLINLKECSSDGNFNPGIPQVAVFDTAFHRTTRRIMRIWFALRDVQEYGVRRYGFHRTSRDMYPIVLQVFRRRRDQKDYHGSRR